MFFIILIILMDENKCIICHKEYNIFNDIKLDCGHYFHEVCIFKYKEEKDACPVCGKKITKKNYNLKKNVQLCLFIFFIFIIILILLSFLEVETRISPISKKIYYLIKAIFINIYNLMFLIFDIIAFFIIRIIFVITKFCINFGYILLTIVKLIYRILGLVIIILLGILIVIMDILVDMMNYIAFIPEKIFKFI